MLEGVETGLGKFPVDLAVLRRYDSLWYMVSQRWRREMDSVIERFEHAGLRVKVGWEEDSSFCNPRENDDGNLGVMVCWHPDYVLGDFQLRNAETGRGAVDSAFETARGRTDFSSMRALERYLRLVCGARVVLPLYLYDHSGISISAGAPNPFDNPHVRSDEYGVGLGWDSSMVGFIYADPSRVERACGRGDYRPADWAGDQASWLEAQLRAEVDVYDQWLRGEVYYFVVEDGDGEMLDACGGFLGGGVDEQGRTISGLDFCIREAKEAAEAEAEAIVRRRREVALAWGRARLGVAS